MPVRSTRSVWVSPSSSATTMSTANWRGVSPLVRASDEEDVCRALARAMQQMHRRAVEVFTSFSHFSHRFTRVKRVSP